MRRILQAQGAEVIHLGHNRSVDEVARRRGPGGRRTRSRSAPTRAATSSTSSTWCAPLRERGAGHIRVYGGGGGTIVPGGDRLPARRRGGADLLARGRPAAGPGRRWSTRSSPSATGPRPTPAAADSTRSSPATSRRWPRRSPRIETGALPTTELDELRARRGRRAPSCSASPAPAGPGKSSLTDELIRRLRLDQHDKLRTAVLAIDPTRRTGGGALLGDRIRMNCLGDDRVYFRSLATRGSGAEVPGLPAATWSRPARRPASTWSIVETPGIGQGDSAIVDARRPARCT